MSYLRSPRSGVTTLFLLINVFAVLAGPALQANAASDAGNVQSLVNAERAKSGLGSLGGSGGLDQVARSQAQRMADRDAIYHNPNLGSDADAAGVNWTLIGENVGVGEDVGTVHDAFMASPGHRANIVHGDYTVIGTGVAAGRDGSVFVAQVFARVQGSAPKAVAPAPTKVARKAATPAPVVAAVSETPQPTAQPPAAPAASAPAAPADLASTNALIGGIVN